MAVPSSAPTAKPAPWNAKAMAATASTCPAKEPPVPLSPTKKLAAQHTIGRSRASTRNTSGAVLPLVISRGWLFSCRRSTTWFTYHPRLLLLLRRGRPEGLSDATCTGNLGVPSTDAAWMSTCDGESGVGLALEEEAAAFDRRRRCRAVFSSFRGAASPPAGSSPAVSFIRTLRGRDGFGAGGGMAFICEVVVRDDEECARLERFEAPPSSPRLRFMPWRGIFSVTDCRLDDSK